MEQGSKPAFVKGEKLIFSKFDGGKMVTCEGTFHSVTAEFVRVNYVDEDGGKHTCRFRRAPGGTSGWGVGPSKFWRLGSEARKKYCHPDVSLRRR